MASTPQENAALVREFLTGVATGDTDAVGIFLTDEAVDHHPVIGDRSHSERVNLLWWRVLAAADVDIAIDDVVAADDTVAVRGTVTGIHCESLMDLAPTGRSFEIAAVWFCRIDERRIAEIWSLPDGLSLIEQLGTAPGDSRTDHNHAQPNNDDHDTR